ncbi:MAG TPA: TlpA disulfide reductase family protein [Ktedonobacteraceae bacterium]|nr:TlpA disulfide reductase family protein [Ktedonobacteraceae bacterium]
MARKLSTEQQEQNLAREQRNELKQELAEHYASLPHKPIKSRRVIFLVLGFIGLLVVVFSLLAFWPSSSQSSVGGIPSGTAAPNFNLPVYGGGGVGSTISLSSLRGHPVILNFWSESCLPCLSEIPYLERVNTQYATRDQFALVGIDQADPQEDIRPFGQTYHVTYPLLFDQGGNVNQQYSVTAIPTTYFIDSQGIVRYVIVQPLTPATFKQGLTSLGISFTS